VDGALTACRHLGLAVLIACALLALQAVPAQAATSGSLSVHVEGSIGAPVLDQMPLTIWPFTAAVTLRGLVDASGEVDSTLVFFQTGDPNRPYVIGALWSDEVEVGGRSQSVSFACAVTEIGRGGEPLGGPCTVVGAIVGRGTFQVSRLELRAGGALAWNLTIPRAFCPLC
jgi:hypothetical protein